MGPKIFFAKNNYAIWEASGKTGTLRRDQMELFFYLQTQKECTSLTSFTHTTITAFAEEEP